jgi:hypothetical protein
MAEDDNFSVVMKRFDALEKKIDASIVSQNAKIETIVQDVDDIRAGIEEEEKKKKRLF